MPFSILVELSSGIWAWTYQWGFLSCLFYIYIDVFLCTCSIVHMTVISFDRYLGISQPLKRHNKQKRTVMLKICLVWQLTTIISSPLAILSFIDNDNVLNDNRCGIRSRSFMLYGSVFSFIIPLVIMALTTHRTTSLLQRQAILLCTSKASDRLSGCGLRRTIAPQRKARTSTNSDSIKRSKRNSQQAPNRQFSVSTGPPIRRNNSNNQSLKSVEGLSPMLARVEKGSLRRAPVDSPVIRISEATDEKCDNAKNASTRKKYSNDESSCGEMSFASRKASKFSPSWSNGLLLRKQGSNDSSGGRSTPQLGAPKGRKRRSKTAELASEQKATRVLIVVFSSFFICWTPFFVQNIVLGICGLDECGFPAWASLCALWFGYCSSTINPIIYTIFNKRFREVFIRILKCYYWCGHRRREGEFVTSQFFWPTLTDVGQYFSSTDRFRQRNNESSVTMLTTDRAPAQRRSSYAAGMPIPREMNLLTANAATATFRRSSNARPLNLAKLSTVSVPPLQPANAMAPQRRRLSECPCPPTRMEQTRLALPQRKLTNRISLPSPETKSKLYTISDSEEDEFKTTTSESNGEEVAPLSVQHTARRLSAFDGVSRLARNFVHIGGKLRRKSSPKCAQSMSNVSQCAQMEGQQHMKRELTVHILCPLTPLRQTNDTNLDNNNEPILATKKDNPPTSSIANGHHIHSNGAQTKCAVRQCNDSASLGDASGESCSGDEMAVVPEQFFAQQIHEFRATRTAI